MGWGEIGGTRLNPDKRIVCVCVCVFSRCSKTCSTTLTLRMNTHNKAGDWSVWNMAVVGRSQERGIFIWTWSMWSRDSTETPRKTRNKTKRPSVHIEFFQNSSIFKITLVSFRFFFCYSLLWLWGYMIQNPSYTGGLFDGRRPAGTSQVCRFDSWYLTAAVLYHSLKTLTALG